MSKLRTWGMNYFGGRWFVRVFSNEDMHVYLIYVVEEREGDRDSQRRKCDVR